MESLEPGSTVRPVSDPSGSSRQRAACLIVAMDGTRPLDPPSRHWLTGLDEVLLRRSPVGMGRVYDRAVRRGRQVLTLAVPDPTVSAKHAELRFDDGRWTIIDRGSTNGTLVNGVRASQRPLIDGDVIFICRVCVVFRELELDEAPTPLDVSADGPVTRGLPPGLRTMSPSLERTFADAMKVVRSTASVMILGATGTGKELAAVAIHQLSGRTGPLVAVNCSELRADLTGSEMFGHCKGAFTGALSDKKGLVMASSGGTLFLDEVGELARPVQAMLLRALQEREVRPVGATGAQPVDLRVVSATHVDIDALIEAKAFREDLRARLVGYTLRLPRLRDRKEDLGLLIRGLLARHGAEGRAPTLTVEAMSALFAYDWPRNIRELGQVIELALLRAEQGEIAHKHLPDDVGSRSDPEPDRPSASPRRPTGPLAFTRERLEALLRDHRGATQAAGAAVGVTRQAIEKWCKKLGVDHKVFRTTPGPMAPDDAEAASEADGPDVDEPTDRR